MTLKQKRAQFYIFAAIVLSAYALALAIPSAKQVSQSPFKNLYQNYIFEAPKVINSAFYNETGPSARLANFSDDYVEFARSFDARFGLMHAYFHDGITDVRSRLNGEVNITAGSASFMLKDNSTAIQGSGFTAHIDGNSYEFNLSKEVRLQALFISQSGQDNRVYKS